ncbi:hypothetical protein [Acinetobacter bereziniae]|uniref:hypothetical protein n=1 Tax=Acinetobacter bereziniae TaxID=106648 RepID=UPI00125099C6|nr:hypothetical protein [Acinetobacter bereziniae]
MNAVDFVKNQISEFGLDAGWEKAKAHIDYLISYGSEFGHVSKEEVEELEHLVKSWELVESKGGIKSAKKEADCLFDNGIEGRAFEIYEAIVDVESVGGGV